jgi:hypothetical protein
MKITDLLSKPAVVQLKDVVSGDVLPVHVKIKPAEDKIVKEAIRNALIDAPKLPDDNSTDAEKLAYIDAMDKTQTRNRVIAQFDGDTCPVNILNRSNKCGVTEHWESPARHQAGITAGPKIHQIL